MLELFLNPFSMMLGGMLISSPIIIHLINRIRFKRIRWAAMEFLLKAQKKNRRRLILEQLLLLLLRILIVLLLGFLLGRFLGCSNIDNAEAGQTMHIFLLDDTASMGDAWREEGEAKDTFSQAKKMIVDKLANLISQAPTAQLAQVLLMSDLDNPRNFGRINTTTIDEMRSFLNPLKPSPLHIDLSAALGKVKAEIDAAPKMQHVLHLISDFRSVDWIGKDQLGLKQQFEEIAAVNTRIFFVDVAHPEVTSSQKGNLFHDNLGIIDLRPDTRIAGKNMPIEFTVSVANYSNAEQKNVRLSVKLNGIERAEGSVLIPSLPPNEITSGRFTLQLERTGSEETPLERFNLISAHLPNEQAGLNIDNSRFTVVEVRDRVPMLIVEGKTNLLRLDRGRYVPISKEAESFYLYKLFTEPIKGYDVQIKTAADLDKLNLQQYVSIFLCDVPRISEVAIKNLEEYVRSGGGLSIFLGPDIKIADAQFYNEKLYADGKGIFPAPIELKPTMDGVEDVVREKTKAERLFSFQMQMFPRDMRHPALERLYTDARGQRINPEEYNKFLRFVIIDRYFPVKRIEWKYEPNTVQELMTLPNLKSMANYQPIVEKLMAQLPSGDDQPEKYKPYKEVLERFKYEIRTTASSGNEPLYKLANKLEELLTYPGDKDKKIPSLKELWLQPEQENLARELQVLLDTVRFGDPLYIAKQLGNGRILAWLSSAGGSWNELDVGRAYYPPLMIEMQRYLASAGTDVNLTLGNTYEFRFDPLQYTSKVKKAFMTQEESTGMVGRQSSTSSILPKGEQVMETKNATDGKPVSMQLNFNEGKLPGIYLFEFSQNAPAEPGKSDGPQIRPEYRALAYNMDTKAEGNLRRASHDELLASTTKETKVVTPNTIDEIEDVLKQKKHDLSESPWLYLILLIFLICEQAMAVRLSFHLKGNETITPNPIVTGQGIVR